MPGICPTGRNVLLSEVFWCNEGLLTLLDSCSLFNSACSSAVSLWMIAILEQKKQGSGMDDILYSGAALCHVEKLKWFSCLSWSWTALLWQYIREVSWATMAFSFPCASLASRSLLYGTDELIILFLDGGENGFVCSCILNYLRKSNKQETGIVTTQQVSLGILISSRV